MNIKKKLLLLAGKKDFELDDIISNMYIIRLCWKYGWMILHGKLSAFAYKNISNIIFVGKKVRLYEKKLITIGEKAKLHNGVKIDALSTDGVSIGSCVVIGENTVIECTGGLSQIGKGVKIGNRTSFGNDCFFGAAGGIEIGEDVVAGQFIRFHSENHNYADTKKLIREQGVTHEGIRIGNNCWIGAGAVFLDGAAIGNGCVVAANAVVTKAFPDNCVVAGVPAKVIKQRGNSPHYH